MLPCRRHIHVVGAQKSTLQTGLGQLSQQNKPILVGMSQKETGAEINGALMCSCSHSQSLGICFWSGVPIGISSPPIHCKRFGNYHQLPHRIESTLAKCISKCHTRKVRTNLEWEAHRAAQVYSSVGLKHHVVVHLQHSALPHENLSAGLARHSQRTNGALP